MIRVRDDTFRRVLEEERKANKRFKSWDKRIKDMAGIL